jgi:hypothetical protein
MTPGFFEIVIVSTSSGSGAVMNVRLRNTSGVAPFVPALAALGNPQIFSVQLVNHGWAVSSLLAGYNDFIFSRVNSAQTTYSVGIMLEDAQFSLEAYNSLTSGGNTLQVFGDEADAT